MKDLAKSHLYKALLMLSILSSCSSPSDIKPDIAGKYSSSDENEYDYFKDTIEVKFTDEGKFDIQTIANWSAAKKNDPQRPNKNKLAGVWNSYGKGEIAIATLQTSDTTLRITDPMTAAVRILKANLVDKTITELHKDGSKTVYSKIN